MKQGFIKVAGVTPDIQVANPVYNREMICQGIDQAVENGASIIGFPELCITGYTCQDLFLQDALLEEALCQLHYIAAYTKGKEALVFVGLPLLRQNKLYNVAAALYDGKVVGFIPKTNIPTYGEFYEGRYFVSGNEETKDFYLEGQQTGEMIPFGTRLLFEIKAISGLRVGCEICEDIWVVSSPATTHALGGATMIVNLSASNETVGKASYRRMLVEASSARLITGYLFVSAGPGESTQDVVFGGHNMIAENGNILAEKRPFETGIIYGDIDIQRIVAERRRMSTFGIEQRDTHTIVSLEMKQKRTILNRHFKRLPFVPETEESKAKRCEEIFAIQAHGLKKRYQHTGLTKAVLGVSGGLDSTLAMLVTAKTFDLLGIDRKNIIAVTMPCFGTTDRTYDNACKLTQALGATLREVNIREAVALHFRDIGQDMNCHDVTYENAQARERTQVIMDIANQENGLVIGTGDLSELALGWATYNGDHMSMYGVNGGVPKTLIRHLVQYYAKSCCVEALEKILLDVVHTPVSPELLPPIEGKISQKTEDLVGPYELHDFFLYYMLRCSFGPAKIYRVAKLAFDKQYENTVILKWLRVFYNRFFSQQFKRSCLPDGPKVGSVAVSPRGDLRMPSDACVTIWLKQLEDLIDE